MVKKSISKLKKLLDKWFSLFIRLRDADDNGLCQCFTCGKVDHYKKLQCGHFQSRRKHSTRWDIRNCQVQCVKCNMFNQGEQYLFAIGLDSKYGEGTADELIFLSNQTTKFTRVEYEDYVFYYKSIVENLKQEKNLE
jgi:hypothetical protein